MIERHIDYLQFSASFSEINAIQNQLQVISAPKFYSRGYIGHNGIRYYFGNPNSKKAFVVVSGAVLHNLRVGGMDDMKILEWAFDYGAVVSRIDLAVTEWVEDTLVTLQDVENWYVASEFTGSLVKYGAKKVSSFDDENAERPETFYIGDMMKRGKLGIFRAYNKGIELNIGDYLATRLEYEDRGEKAQSTAIRICRDGDIAGNFRARIDCKNAEFERLMEAPAVDTSRGLGAVKVGIEDKMASRWEWLIEQVAPALNEAMKHEKDIDPTSPKLSEFLHKSGLVSEMKRGAELLAYWEHMRDNENNG